MNSTTIKPLAGYVLVEPKEREQRTPSGIVLPEIAEGEKLGFFVDFHPMEMGQAYFVPGRRFENGTLERFGDKELEEYMDNLSEAERKEFNSKRGQMAKIICSQGIASELGISYATLPEEVQIQVICRFLCEMHEFRQRWRIKSQQHRRSLDFRALTVRCFYLQ